MNFDIKSLPLSPEQFAWVTKRVFHEPLGWKKDKNNDGMYMEDLDLKIQLWAHADGTVEITTWTEPLPTFEGSWRDHESCPAHYTDDKGQCLVHDEWFELPTQEEVLDL